MLNWDKTSTGGGCEALEARASTVELLLTDSSGCFVPGDGETLLGGYDAEGCSLFVGTFPTRAAAEAAAEFIAYLYRNDDDPRVLYWQVPAELTAARRAAEAAGIVGIDAEDCYAIKESSC